MEETPSLWNKTTDELTVKDQLIVVAIAPFVIMGAVVAAGAVVTAADKIVKKFRPSYNVSKIKVTEEN